MGSVPKLGFGNEKAQNFRAAIRRGFFVAAKMAALQFASEEWKVTTNCLRSEGKRG
jgi:hypothetical protein